MVRDIYVIGPNDDLLDHWIQNNGSTISLYLETSFASTIDDFITFIRGYPILSYSTVIESIFLIWKQSGSKQ